MALPGACVKRRGSLPPLVRLVEGAYLCPIMTRRSFLSRLLPRGLRPTVPIIPVVRLSGTIGMGTPLRPALTLQGVNEALERAFRRKGIAAVALIVNSPGGSAAQSSLIAGRIRRLAEKHKVRTYAFIEDVAASGGYWIATAADEIYADHSSIVGSIGVMAAGFGFVEAMKKIGVERRVYTSGKNKLMLDPFQPEKQEDVERLKELQLDVHEAFKNIVRTRRGSRLKETEELFSGAFWSGNKALEMGLVDGLGEMHNVLKDKHGDKAELIEIHKPGGWLQRRLGGLSAEAGAAAVSSVVDELEVRALWSRFGL
jgi:signal peptide peptidase SppA